MTNYHKIEDFFGLKYEHLQIFYYSDSFYLSIYLCEINLRKKWSLYAYLTHAKYLNKNSYFNYNWYLTSNLQKSDKKIYKYIFWSKEGLKMQDWKTKQFKMKKMKQRNHRRKKMFLKFLSIIYKMKNKKKVDES